MVDKNKKETKFKKFLNENKSLAVMLPILVDFQGKFHFPKVNSTL